MDKFESTIISHDVANKISVTRIILSSLFIWAVFNILIYNQVVQKSSDKAQVESVVFISTLVFLLISALFLVYRFKGYLRKVGRIVISEDEIAISSKVLADILKVDQVDDLILIYSHYKVPLLLLPGNKNSIEFKRDNKRYKFEFLIRSKKEYNKLVSIVELWYKNGIQLHETDSRGYSQYLLKPIEPEELED